MCESRCVAQGSGALHDKDCMLTSLQPFLAVCIIIPAGCAPIIGTLFWAQYRAKKLGVVATNYGSSEDARIEADSRSLGQKVIGHIIDIDVFGTLSSLGQGGVTTHQLADDSLCDKVSCFSPLAGRASSFL